MRTAQRKIRGKFVSDNSPADTSAAIKDNPLDDLIGYKLRRAQLVTFQEFMDKFYSLGLRPAEFAVLMALQRHPGLKQADVAEMLAIKGANFVSLMDTMEKRGLAERQISSADRRSYALFLTKEGEKVAADAATVSADFEELLTIRLGGRQETKHLMKLLDRLVVENGPAS